MAVDFNRGPYHSRRNVFGFRRNSRERLLHGISFEIFVSFVANPSLWPSERTKASLDEPILQRLGDVLPFDTGGRREIGDGPRDLQQPVVAACAEGEPLGGGEQQRSSCRVRAAMRRDGFIGVL